MVGKLVEESRQYLTLDKQTLDTIYQHVWFLANFRFSRPIEVLKTRHTSYDKEDFVQEVVTLVCDLFKTKKFPTVNHLKKMIRLTMSYHYLHEKRKYFYTKSRGGFYSISLEEDINEYRKIEDTVVADKLCDNESLYDLHRLYQKNLYVACNWHTYTVITKDKFKDFTNCMILSVNMFIQKQKDCGMNETCKFYKNNGFYMTRGVFDKISQSIISYLKDSGIILIEDIKEHIKPKKRLMNDSIDIEETRLNLMKHYDFEFNDILEDEELTTDKLLDTSEDLIIV